MQRLIRCLFLAYVVLLTSLLLVSNPLEFLTWRLKMPSFFLMDTVHFEAIVNSWIALSHVLSFTVLAVLAIGARWPLPQWMILAVLVLYGAGTEIAQSFSSTRTPELEDLLQDILGVGLGSAFCWVGATLLCGVARSRRRSPESDASEPQQNVIETTAARPPIADGPLQGIRSVREHRNSSARFTSTRYRK